MEIENNNKTTQKKQKLILPILILLILIVLGVITGVLLTNNKNKSTSTINKSAAISPVNISINNQGITPSTTTVKIGQSVVWTNNDTQKHQIATDPYPADNGVSGFKSTTLNTNDSYSFSFTSVGKFTYHDELNPYKLKGEIIVKN